MQERMKGLAEALHTPNNNELNKLQSPISSIRERATAAARAAATDRDARIGQRQRNIRNAHNEATVRVWSTALDQVKPPTLKYLDAEAIRTFTTRYVQYVQKLERICAQHDQQAQPVPVHECMK